MILKNAKIVNENIEVIDSDISIVGEKIEKIAWHIDETAEDTINLSGYTILPGFIDQHTHGCAGFDTCDASKEGIRAISLQMAKNGVTIALLL